MPKYEEIIASADRFFRSNTPPANLPVVANEIQAFSTARIGTQSKVVFITSGGTSVPLEKNTVRFLDNFSQGLRGAASAERFLELGYDVVMLRRTGTAAPFARHLLPLSPRIDGRFLSVLETSGNELRIRKGVSPLMRAAVIKYQELVRNGRYLEVEFESLAQYIYLLKTIACGLSPLGSRVMFYSAAAVADFYVPESDMATHKIQSAEGSLQLTLPPTPKMLAILSRDWLPLAFLVSFKLETDESLLLGKARAAIDNYGVHAVVANELHTRYRKIQIITRSDVQVLTKKKHQTTATTTTTMTTMTTQSENKAEGQQVVMVEQEEELEVPLCRTLRDMHAAFQNPSRAETKDELRRRVVEDSVSKGGLRANL